MVRRFVVAFLLIAAVQAQTPDCDTDGPFIGSVCVTDADCNQGECALVHSKCSDALECDCSIGYWGENSTRTCASTKLDEACTTSDQCAASTANAQCSSGDVCECGPGYEKKATRIGHKYCSPLDETSSCTPGPEGDAYCQAGGLDSCSFITVCRCPSGSDFILEEGASNGTCFQKSSDSSCATCVNSGGTCYVDANSVIQCSCPSTKYSSTGDPMSTGCDRGQALVGGVCQPDGTVTCADDNAECEHFGTMRKRYICQCITGYVRGPAFDNPDKEMCHEELSSRIDANCAKCDINEGQCYDLDGDDVHDVCKCPTSKSTSDPDDYDTYCDTTHVNVTCDSDSMHVCYTPHNTMEFPQIGDALQSGESLLFVKDKIHDQNCHLTPTEGAYCIDLEYGTFLSCDTTKYDLSEHVVSYTNWIILQRQPEKRTVNDMYMYVYCSYDSLVNAFTGHVAVEIGEPPAVAAEGEMIQAGVRLSILDEFSNDASASGVILGQQVQLLANITDDKGVFREIKAEVCLASNLPDLASPFARTTLMMYDGCPEVNSLLDEELIFTEDLGNSKVTRTNMFSMFKFDDSEYVFFHCALRVCMDGNTAECDASVCARRKRDTGYLALAKRGEAGLAHRKMMKAMSKFEDPNFTVSVNAVKVKRAVDTKRVGIAESPESLPSDEDRSLQGSDFGRRGMDQTMQFSTSTIMAIGGGVGFLVLSLFVVIIVLALKRPSRGSTSDVEAGTRL